MDTLAEEAYHVRHLHGDLSVIFVRDLLKLELFVRLNDCLRRGQHHLSDSSFGDCSVVNLREYFFNFLLFRLSVGALGFDLLDEEVELGIESLLVGGVGILRLNFVLLLPRQLETFLFVDVRL